MGVQLYAYKFTTFWNDLYQNIHKFLKLCIEIVFADFGTLSYV